MKISLTVDLNDEATSKQRKQFGEELLKRNFEEISTPMMKWRIDYEDSLSEKAAISAIKKEFSDVTQLAGIKKYSVIAHFEKSNMVIFFSGQSMAFTATA